MSVYSRMMKLRSNSSMGEKLEVIAVAILNLENTQDIVEFAKEYATINKLDYKHDIQYVLSFGTMEQRTLWKEALEGFVFVDVLYQRHEKELYKWQEYIDANYNSLDEYNQYTNTEKGQHQNILSVGPHK